MCDRAELKKPDVNVFLLFAIAVGIVFVAFHTPELQLVQEMSDEELEET